MPTRRDVRFECAGGGDEVARASSASWGRALPRPARWPAWTRSRIGPCGWVWGGERDLTGTRTRTSHAGVAERTILESRIESEPSKSVSYGDVNKGRCTFHRLEIGDGRTSVAVYALPDVLVTQSQFFSAGGV